MRKVIRVMMQILLAIVLAAVVIVLWKREELMRLWSVNTLFDAERIVGNFSDMEGAFLTREVARGDAPVSALPQGTPATLPEGTDAWIKERNVTALVVLKGGAVVHESYHLGTTAEDRRISWSVAKSYLSALMGVILADGAIASIDDPVIKYAPSLRGSAYETASIRNVLNMASGVKFNEDYLDKESDINRMGRVIALGGTLDGFTRDLIEQQTAPGEAWQYVSIDTHVIGMVIRGATGRPIADLLSEKIIAPLGLETTPYYITDGDGVAFVLGGLNMRTRDYARFGQMILQNGAFHGRQIVPADWVAASTAPSAPTEAGETGYGFQWWIPADASEGEFMARGVYGQYIYIDRARDVVIASNAADRGFRQEGVPDQNLAMLRAIASGI